MIGCFIGSSTRYRTFHRKERDQCGDGKPQEALHQKEHEAPKPKSLNPTLSLQTENSNQAALIKISALSVSRAAGGSNDLTKI